MEKKKKKKGRGEQGTPAAMSSPAGSVFSTYPAVFSEQDDSNKRLLTQQPLRSETAVRPRAGF